MNKETNELKQASCLNVRAYTLVNNDGYTFNKGGQKYDLRHWLMCYGVAVDFYELSCLTNDGSYFTKTFNTFDGALKFIQTL